MGDQESLLEQAVRGRYRLERELGRGGMAVVYLAEDLRHRRRVALKVLKPELAQALGAERFLREIQTAAQLTHPHILPLHDSGEAAGLLYYVMPYVDGESLRERLNRERQLPVADAVRIATEVADALAYAHSRGVVHRDIKPENILLQAGHALVSDFGIARAVGEAGGDRLTEPGLAVGTPAYMSPEQASGDQVIDGRSDIYSLACVVYEMLAGEPPFAGPSAQAILARRLLDSPRSITATRRSVPLHVDAAVRRALSPTPADRFATGTEFAAALARGERSDAGGGGRWARWIGGSAVAAVATVAVVLVWRSDAPSSTPAPAVAAPTTDSVASLVVLPFVNVSSDEESEYFSDGMTDELINALSRIDGLRVVARTSAFSFKGKGLDAREIGRRLAVANVLEGSVRKTGRQVRVTAQLIDARTGFQLWSEKYDRTLKDVLAIQDEISNAIASRFRLRLGASAATPAASTPESEEALELYLKGRFFWNKRTEQGVTRSIEYFHQAIDKDSTYARTYAGLGDAYNILAAYSFIPPATAFARAREAAVQALRLDSTLPEAHAALGFVLFQRDHDWREAEARFRTAIRLDPDYPTAHHWYSLLLSDLGRHDEAISSMRRAQALDPLSLIINTILATRYLFARRYDEARAQIGRALELDPSYPLALFWLGQIELKRGNREAATAALRRAVAADSTNPMMHLGLAYVLAAAGERGEAAAIVRRVPATFGERVAPVHMAWAHHALGQRDDAVAWLERGYQRDDLWINNLAVDPLLDGIHSDPRVRRLLARLRLDDVRPGR